MKKTQEALISRYDIVIATMNTEHVWIPAQEQAFQLSITNREGFHESVAFLKKLVVGNDYWRRECPSFSNGEVTGIQVEKIRE